MIRRGLAADPQWPEKGWKPAPDHYARRSEKAGTSAARAATEGRCGEAFDDYTVAVALHHKDIIERKLPVGDKGSWQQMQLARGVIRERCLLNRTGQGMAGATKRRKKRT